MPDTKAGTLALPEAVWATAICGEPVVKLANAIAKNEMLRSPNDVGGDASLGAHGYRSCSMKPKITARF
jgi:hypothetical protein